MDVWQGRLAAHACWGVNRRVGSSLQRKIEKQGLAKEERGQAAAEKKRRTERDCYLGKGGYRGGRWSRESGYISLVGREVFFQVRVLDYIFIVVDFTSIMVIVIWMNHALFFICYLIESDLILHSFPMCVWVTFSDLVFFWFFPPVHWMLCFIFPFYACSLLVYTLFSIVIRILKGKGFGQHEPFGFHIGYSTGWVASSERKRDGSDHVENRAFSSMFAML